MKFEELVESVGWPFTGSGSTGKAAALEGFQFIGCDLDSDYCEIASRRIAFAAKQRQPQLELV